jgi:hypothetical protein
MSPLAECTRSSDAPIDLLQRNAGGTDVRLLWNRTAAALTLRVVDREGLREVEFSVPAEHAQYAFDHPYAYGFAHPDRRIHETDLTLTTDETSRPHAANDRASDSGRSAGP